MTILFAGGENSEFDYLNATTTTDSTKFRATYARCAMRSFGDNGVLHTFSGELSAYLAAQPSGDKDFWYGFQYVGAGGNTTLHTCVMFCGAGLSPFLRIFNALNTGTGVCQMQLSSDGVTWGDIPTSIIAQPSTPTEWTFRIKLHATLGKFQWWIGGALWWEVTGNTLVYASTCTRASFGDGGSNRTCAISEVVATSSDDSRVGMNCFTAYYTGNGANTAWTGSYTDINENSEDTSTILSAASAGLDSCFTHASLPTLGSGTIVRAVLVSGKWRTGTSAPQNLYGYLRIGSTNYANAPLPASIQAVQSVQGLLQYIWHLSPATGLAFTQTEVNALQPGMRSAA